MTVGSVVGRLVVDRTLLEDEGRLLSRELVAGLPLLTRQILGLEHAGVSDVEVAADADVLDTLRRVLEQVPRIESRRINVVDAAQPVGRPSPWTLVQPANLVVDPRALKQLIAVAEDSDRPVIAVDRFASNYPVAGKSPFADGAPGGFDGRVVDATEMREGKLFPIGVRLERAVAPGGAASAGRSPVFLDIGRYGWHRMMDATDAATATSKILLGTIKPTDGIYARTNRRVSIAISRVLLPTPVTPNQVTVATLVCSGLAGVVMSGGTYASFVLGGFIGWFASMLDGVDGELARAKFQASELGHWLEMACDYGFCLAVVGGYGAGLSRATGHEVWLALAAFGWMGVAVTFVAVARNKRQYAEREPGGDYYVAFQRTTSAHSSNPVHLFTRCCTFLVTRAVFPYYIVSFALLGLSKMMFVMVLAGTHLSWILTLYAGRLKPTLAPRRVASGNPVPAMGPGARATAAADEL